MLSGGHTASFLKTCHEFQVPVSLERSRSGNGGHIWIFFNEPIAAKTARMLGTPRYFPRDKKLGNLIALPFQRIPGEAGNSLFIDENHQHYKDQWTFLFAKKDVII